MATERWVDVWKKKAILADWPTLRLLLGVLAGYTTVNLMLRGISGQVPPAVVAMWRLLPLCLYATAMMTRESERKALATLGSRGRQGLLVIVGLVFGGVASYVVGNTVFQQAITHTGVSLAVPAAQGGALWAGLIIGALWFRESPTLGRIVGTVVMVVGIAVLSEQQGGAAGGGATSGLFFAVLAGCCWTLSGVMLRYAYRHGATPHTGQLISTCSAFAILWSVTFITQGVFAYTATPALLAQMLLVGVVNAITLTCSAMALRRTEVVVVNMFSAGSLALSTLGAVWLFGEPWSASIALGLVLTLGGLVTAQVAKK